MNLLDAIFQQLVEWGMSEANASRFAPWVAIAGIALIGWIADRIAKKLILRGVGRLIEKSENKLDDILLEANVFGRLSRLAPALVVFYGIEFLFPTRDALVEVLQRITLVYMIAVGFLTLSSLLSALATAYDRQPIAKRRPIKSYLQVLKIVLYFLCAIFIIANLLGTSPWGLISLLGGVTAVLILVFKDTILGFVASVQLTTNDMVAKGDWISMPKYGADGDVIDISVHNVKVQNWDKTITTIPTYALVSDSFTNWRGMQESGGRRIKRSIWIDMNSVRFCDPDLLAKFRRIDCLKDYIERKEKELEVHNRAYGIDTSVAVNGRRMTNLGSFRAYLGEYLRRHPKLHQGMTMLVRYLEPTPQGMPVEIYAFSADQAWASYEAIQADIFDHILAILPEFDLKVFQNPSGGDFYQAIAVPRTAGPN